MEAPQKIHVIGPSGAGKTTLAERVASLIGTKVIKLDDIVYKNFKRRPIEDIEEELRDLKGQEGWVTEGIYVDRFMNRVFAEADKIVWMDLPLYVNVSRVTKRFIKQKLTGQDKWGTISFLKLLHGTIGYSFNKRGETSGDDGDIGPKILENLFAPYKDKLIRIRNNKQYREFLKSIQK